MNSGTRNILPSVNTENISWRREVLRRGDFLLLEATHKAFVYRRRLGAESITVALNFSDRTARVGKRGKLLRSNYSWDSFDGFLQPWEAVILDDQES